MQSNSTTRPLLIVLCGPTVSGKTNVAVEIAKRLQTEIISADSRQFYREMNIGTATPTQEEMQGVPHHFLNFLSIDENYDVGKFETDALAKLQHIHQHNHKAVMAGGSGLYIRAVCQGLDPFPNIDPSIRQQLNQLYSQEGIAALQQQLQDKDPAYYNQVDINNPHRLLRALEVTIATGQPFSSYRQGKQIKRPFRILSIGLSLPREQLYERINKRVDRMMHKGLLEEVKQLQPYQHYQALQTVGYRELYEYVNGKLDLPTAIEQIKAHTRQYAKRQLTWFRRDKTIHWFHPSDIEKMLKLIQRTDKENA